MTPATPDSRLLTPDSFPVEELTKLLQLASPALPLGSFSYSHGLETAIEAGLVRNAATTRSWIESGLRWVLGRCELPIFFHQFTSWQTRCVADLQALDRWFLASRETKELREETEQLGWSLARLALSLEINDEPRRDILRKIRPVSFPTVYAFVAQGFLLDPRAAAAAYCFSWSENQVAAALKAVPLGQTEGQKIIAELRPCLTEVIAQGELPLAQITTYAPHLAILSARHENLYTRLFRS